MLNTRTVKDNGGELRLGHTVLSSQLLLYTFERNTGSKRPARQCCSLLQKTQTLLKLLQIIFFQPVLQTIRRQAALLVAACQPQRSHIRKARVQKCQAQKSTAEQPGLTSVSRPSQCPHYMLIASQIQAPTSALASSQVLRCQREVPSPPSTPTCRPNGASQALGVS